MITSTNINIPKSCHSPTSVQGVPKKCSLVSLLRNIFSGTPGIYLKHKHILREGCKKVSDKNIFYFFILDHFSSTFLYWPHHAMCWPHCMACCLHKILMGTARGLRDPQGGGVIYMENFYSLELLKNHFLQRTKKW